MDTKITINEATNRGNNLLTLALTTFTGIGLLAELIREPDFIDKLDDIAIILLAITAIVWYFTGRNRYKLSWFPYILLAVSAAVKVGAVLIELKDTSAVGDDFGLVIPLVVMSIIVGIAHGRARRDEMQPVSTSAPEIMQSGD